MKPLEPFEPIRSAPSGRGIPSVRIQADGRLVLNAAAARLLDGVEHVRLLWDSDTRQIALQPTAADDSFAFKVTHVPSQAVVTSREFVARLTIATPASLRLTWADGMLITTPDEPANPPG